MRRIEYLVTQARRASNNTDTNRISTDEVLQYFNDAKDRLQSLIHQEHPDNEIFNVSTDVDLVARQEAYDLPSDIYAINAISNVELKEYAEGGVNIYQPLRKLTSKERNTIFGYSIQNKKLLLSPIPDVALEDGLRVTYAKKLATIDVRRGTISAFTSGTSVTVTGFSDLLTSTSPDDYFCIVDKDGVQKASGLVLTSFNTGSGTISTTSTFSGVSIGDYVVLGKDSTTHCDLPDMCERYLIEYVVARIQMRDSNVEDILAESALLQALEMEIVSLFANNSSDPIYPPITNYDYSYDD